jgi:[acyl-carrier-protein] S-malonyltransferase
MSKILFVFPGQGSQYRGMGSDLINEFPVVRDLYTRASAVLGYDLTELSFRDPNDQLNLTRFTQPALLTHEVACLEAFRSLTGERVKPALTAGHSLGEYTALVNAGALSFESAVKLVQRRGEVMSEFGRGGMLATTLDLPAAAALADKHFCGIGGCNLPDQTVVAGEVSAQHRGRVSYLPHGRRGAGVSQSTGADGVRRAQRAHVVELHG